MLIVELCVNSLEIATMDPISRFILLRSSLSPPQSALASSKSIGVLHVAHKTAFIAIQLRKYTPITLINLSLRNIVWLNLASTFHCNVYYI